MQKEREPVPEDTEVICREEIGRPAGGKTGEKWNHGNARKYFIPKAEEDCK